MDPAWIYAALFFIAFLENVFPPSPSDVAVVFGGALAAMGKGEFLPTLLAATLGGTVGFMTMYAVGKWFGRRVLEAGRLRWVPMDKIHRLEEWFGRYGYWLIVANRFLSGTRAVVSFFAGLSQLKLTTTTILSFLSSLVWYGILVYAGYSLGRNWESIGDYLKTYSQIVTGIVVLITLIVLTWWLFASRRRRKRHG